MLGGLSTGSPTAAALSFYFFSHYRDSTTSTAAVFVGDWSNSKLFESRSILSPAFFFFSFFLSFDSSLRFLSSCCIMGRGVIFWNLFIFFFLSFLPNVWATSAAVAVRAPLQHWHDPANDDNKVCEHRDQTDEHDPGRRQAYLSVFAVICMVFVCVCVH